MFPDYGAMLSSRQESLQTKYEIHLNNNYARADELSNSIIYMLIQDENKLKFVEECAVTEICQPLNLDKLLYTHLCCVKYN